jgi:hypothetical protein
MAITSISYKEDNGGGMGGRNGSSLNARHNGRAGMTASGSRARLGSRVGAQLGTRARPAAAWRRRVGQARGWRERLVASGVARRLLAQGEVELGRGCALRVGRPGVAAVASAGWEATRASERTKRGEQSGEGVKREGEREQRREGERTAAAAGFCQGAHAAVELGLGIMDPKWAGWVYV